MKKYALICLAVLTTGLSTNAQEPPKTMPKKKQPPIEITNSSGGESAPLLAQAPATTEAGAPLYQFNNSGSPQQKDDRNNLQFKVDGTSESADPVAAAANDETFKTYVGYPRHQILPYYYPVSVNSKWTYSGQDFNFSNSSPMGFGIAYRFIATPLMAAELDWNHFETKVKDSTVSPFTVKESSVNIDTLFARFNQYWVSESSFFYRYGYGLELGYDMYPVLNFKTSTMMELSTVRDLVLGFNFALQKPLISNFVLTGKLGYNMGTGTGNSGELTSKLNNTYFLNAGIDWNLNDKSGVNLNLDYRVRRAKVEGKIGSNTDTWETASTTTAFKIAYLHTF